MDRENPSASTEYPVMDTRRRGNRQCREDDKNRWVWRRDG